MPTRTPGATHKIMKVLFQRVTSAALIFSLRCTVHSAVRRAREPPAAHDDGRRLEGITDTVLLLRDDQRPSIAKVIFALIL
jgi:hypothetical protein